MCTDKSLSLLSLSPQCDEHRPRCVNCQTAGLKCAFSTDLSPSSGSTPGPATAPGTGPASSASETSNPTSQSQELNYSLKTPAYTSPDSPDPSLNMHHLELLHHFSTVTYRTFSPEEAHQDIWRGPVVRLGLCFPFLMHELLAISSLHLAYCRPDKAEWYYTGSTELQSNALNVFNSVQRQVDASNCGAILIFTSLLGLHVLADPSRIVGLDNNQYIDHVLGCLMLMRSVRSLVIEGWHTYIKETELKPLFNIQQPSPPYDIPEPCRKLSDIAQNSDLSQEAREAYDSAIERLQWIFALSNVPNERHTTIRWLLAWPIQLREGYLDRLNQRRPEAMIILAYYAVLLHFYRECWAVGDSGPFLIRAIYAHLGQHWAKWMAWPLSFLTSES